MHDKARKAVLSFTLSFNKLYYASTLFALLSLCNGFDEAYSLDAYQRLLKADPQAKWTTTPIKAY